MNSDEAQKIYAAVYSTFRIDIECILSQFPLINVPIKTPRLLKTTLLFEDSACLDSYTILRNYLTALKTFEKKNLILKRPQTCLNWFIREIKSDTLEFRELNNFVANSRWKTENSTHLDYLIDCFKKKTLTPEIFFEKYKDLVSIIPYDSPWSKNKIFIEDITKNLTNCTSTLQNHLEEYFGTLKGTNEEIYHGMCRGIYGGNIYLINLYEKALIHAAYKREYNDEFEQLITAHGEYDPKLFGDEILKSVAANRKNLTEYRRKKEDVIEFKLDPVEHEIKGMPTVDELNTYIAFFDWPIK